MLFLIAKELGVKDGLPTYVQFALPGPLRSGGPNFLGSKYAPFYVSNNPNNPDFKMADVTLPRGVNDRRARSQSDFFHSSIRPVGVDCQIGKTFRSTERATWFHQMHVETSHLRHRQQVLAYVHSTNDD